MASQSVEVAPSLSLLAAAKAHFTLGISEGQSLRGAPQHEAVWSHKTSELWSIFRVI